MREIADGVFQFPFMRGFMNAFAVNSDEGWLVVDTGMGANAAHEIVSSLGQRGVSPQDIGHIFITHAHYDHIGGLAHLQTLTNATTYAHQRETAIIRREQNAILPQRHEIEGIFWRTIYPLATSSSKQNEANLIPARVDVEVKDGTRIANHFTVVTLPGHTYGHIGLWWEERRILFGGDVITHFPMRGLGLPFPVATPDMPEAKRSIQKVAALNVDTLCICHGAPIIGNAHEKIQAFAAKIRG